MLAEIKRVRAIPTDLRNEELEEMETRRKAMLVIKWQRTWLKFGHVLVFCER